MFSVILCNMAQEWGIDWKVSAEELARLEKAYAKSTKKRMRIFHLLPGRPVSFPSELQGHCSALDLQDNMCQHLRPQCAHGAIRQCAVGSAAGRAR